MIPARVVICDDSAIVRAALLRILEPAPEIQVVARASNGQAAIKAVRQRQGTSETVDVVVLDLDMPVMDGLTALPLLLEVQPSLKVLILSTASTPGASAAMRALGLGAADYAAKPSATGLTESLPFEQELVGKVAGLARMHRMAFANGRPAAADRQSGDIARRHPRPLRASPRLMAVGSSTGGPQALFTLLSGIGSAAVPIVIAQHMPPVFTPMLAEHITRIVALPCSEARDGERLQDGHIYVAPGGRHLEIVRSGDGAGLQAAVFDGPAEHHCRPSVDVLLHSAAVACPGGTLVVMLTGMGRDGLDGTRAVVEGGGMALAQDEATSVIWGMPGAIAKAGLCEAVLPLPELAPAVRRLLAV